MASVAEDERRAGSLRTRSLVLLFLALGTIGAILVFLLVLAIGGLRLTPDLWNLLGAAGLAACAMFVGSAAVRRRADRIDPATAPWQRLHDVPPPTSPEEP